jgi:hypothetical protein
MGWVRGWSRGFGKGPRVIRFLLVFAPDPGSGNGNPHVTQNPPHSKEMMIDCAPALKRDICGYAPQNLFARISQNVEELAKIVKRIGKKGGDVCRSAV